MVDLRFNNIKRSSMHISEICELIGSEFCGSDMVIQNVTSIEGATCNDLTFFHNALYKEDLKKTAACACIIKKEHAKFLSDHTAPIVVSEPYRALAILLNVFYEQKSFSVYGNFDVGNNCNIAKSAVIEDGCSIGDSVSIGHNSVIHGGVVIGNGATIESNVVIRCAIIGEKAHIKSGAMIGQQGFGFYISEHGPVDIPQIGKVVIGNNSQIGSNCTIDRGSMDDTIIGNNVRIDNMVHIAHNVNIGDFSVVAGQCGISGSTKIGAGCVIGGQVGIAGHIVIGDRVTIAAQSGVMRNVERGKAIGGSPATSIHSWHRQTIMLQKLAK